MLDYYKKVFPLTSGVFLSLVCIISLIKFIRGFDVFDPSYSLEAIPYLILALLTGFSGIPLFFYGLEKASK